MVVDRWVKARVAGFWVADMVCGYGMWVCREGSKTSVVPIPFSPLYTSALKNEFSTPFIKAAVACSHRKPLEQLEL